MLGALISGGVSLLSGLFGMSGAKKRAKEEKAAIAAANAQAAEYAAQMNKEVRARADAAALVPVQTRRASISGVDRNAFIADAEAMGFNPLTYLRSGALSMYGMTDEFGCTTGERAMDAALAGQHIPSVSPVISQTQVPTAGEVFGNALQAGASQFLSDMNQQQQNNLQRELSQAWQSGANKAGYMPGRSLNSPFAKLTGGTAVGSGIEDMWLPVRDNSAAGGNRTVYVPNPKFFSDPEAYAAAYMASMGDRMNIYTDNQPPRPQSTAERYLDAGIRWLYGADTRPNPAQGNAQGDYQTRVIHPPNSNVRVGPNGYFSAYWQ